MDVLHINRVLSYSQPSNDFPQIQQVESCRFNQLCIKISIHGWLNPRMENHWMWKTNWIHCTTQFYIRNLGIYRFWLHTGAPRNNLLWIVRDDYSILFSNFFSFKYIKEYQCTTTFSVTTFSVSILQMYQIYWVSYWCITNWF